MKIYKVKIIGAGSIGNHLAQAARRMGWDVLVVDTDPVALERMEKDIYPSRYGDWDSAIQLCTTKEDPHNGFDVICIGTPPHIRMELAVVALEEKPSILLLEKPLCTPTLEGLDDFLLKYYAQRETAVVVGYDHALTESIEYVLKLLDERTVGLVETIDVEFREHWQGIFNAHPWLKGPQDTYLGFWEKGGGAGGEHSHALHLWQLLARQAGIGKWKQVDCAMEIKSNGRTFYDSIAAFQFVTDQGKIGRVIQDVITSPMHKWAHIQGKDGYIEWICNGHADGDVVQYSINGNEPTKKVFPKKRPDDFYREMLHIKDIMEKKVSATESPISLESGVAVMKVLSVAYANRNCGALIYPAKSDNE